MNTDNIVIENGELRLAQSICEMILDDKTRNRAMANAIAPAIAEKFFDKNVYDVDSESGLHNIGKVLEDIEISDIYINANYVDVRLFFDENEICVPKSHFDNNILPSAYMFIKINEDLSQGEFLGFIKPENIDKSNCINGYYYINANDFVSFDDISDLFVNRDEQAVKDKDIYYYLDNLLDNKYDFFKKLLNSQIGRKKLAKAVIAEHIFEFISINKDVIEDNNEQSVLDSDLDTDLDGFVIDENSDVDESSGNLSYDSSFSTVTSPNIDLDDDILEELSSEDENDSDINIATDDSENSEQIGALFQDNNDTSFDYNNSEQKVIRKKGLAFPAVLVCILALAALIYWGYTRYSQMPNAEDRLKNDIQAEDNVQNSSEVDVSEEAMPIESVEVSNITNSENVSPSASIQTIEQNLDASILVSNLKVEWEVPASYVSNVSAKRYLTKLGKIIQLNLKTELLLLNKPPITNKICIEIKYDESAKKFEPVGIITSSGESKVDTLILNTVKRVLAMNLNSNTDSFSKLQGNPVLVINL